MARPKKIVPNFLIKHQRVGKSVQLFIHLTGNKINRDGLMTEKMPPDMRTATCSFHRYGGRGCSFNHC